MKRSKTSRMLPTRKCAMSQLMWRGCIMAVCPTSSTSTAARKVGAKGLRWRNAIPPISTASSGTVPVINWVGLQFSGTRTGLVQMDGGWLNPAKVKLLHASVLAACDAADGLQDGIVSRYETCAKTMSPKNLRCPDGKDTGDTLPV